MTPLTALAYSFLFGLLHGILPDEHTWPITFSYAIGSASGREGMKAGLYFSAAFTVQRMLLAELAYLVLAPFLLSPTINGIVYIVVGVVMTVAGRVTLNQNRYPHLHFLKDRHEKSYKGEPTSQPFIKEGGPLGGILAAPPVRLTLVHGFIAGFGVGGFSLFVNTVAVPAMRTSWMGFLPGLFFGLGTMMTLAVVGALFGASLRWVHSLTEQEIKRIGAKTGGRTLFLGGLLFTLFGLATVSGLDRYLPIGSEYALIMIFMIAVAFPAFILSLKEVLTERTESAARSDHR